MVSRISHSYTKKSKKEDAFKVFRELIIYIGKQTIDCFEKSSLLFMVVEMADEGPI
jgi:hypothetical protein